MFLSMGLDGRFKSLSARRAWIEILVAITPSNFSKSLSARRAWIEILQVWQLYAVALSLSARRAWIEIWDVHPGTIQQRRRSPQGERG